MGAKTSIAESVETLFCFTKISNHLVVRFVFYSKGMKVYCLQVNEEKYGICVLCPRDVVFRIKLFDGLYRARLFDLSIEGCGNDPSAGSPTETLLRLHLPLDIEV